MCFVRVCALHAVPQTLELHKSFGDVISYGGLLIIIIMLCMFSCLF